MFTYKQKAQFNLYELCAEGETQMNRNEQVRIANVKSCFSRAMIELAGAYDEDENDDSESPRASHSTWIKIEGGSNCSVLQLEKCS